MAKKPIDEAAAALARVEKARAQEEELAVEWEKKAMMAVRAGNDDLAKQALLRKFEHLVLALEAAGDVEVARDRLEELRAAGPDLRASSSTSSVASSPA